MIRTRGDDLQKALDTAEGFAVRLGLTGKNALNLRLLAEETASLVRAVTGEMEALFWLESEGDGVDLHLSAQTRMTAEKRQELLNASTTGENVAARGFLGAVTDVFERFMEAYVDAPVPDYYAGGLLLSQNIDPATAGISADAVTWSMRQYRSNLDGDRQDEGARDTLERSILANVADEVLVSIRGGRVELTIHKNIKQ